MRLMFVTQALRSYGSGHDVAVWRLVRALSERSDVILTVVTGHVDKDLYLSGCRIIRLPCIPVWHGSIRFLTFVFIWAVVRRWLCRGQDFIVLDSPLYGGGDAAYVHFLSCAWLTRLPTLSLSVGLMRRCHDYWRHGLASAIERFVLAPCRCPLLFPVSDRLACDLAVYCDVSPRFIRVIPNAADPLRYALQTTHREPPYGSRNQTVYRILFVGGSWHRKRLDLAFQALSLLPVWYELDVVGSGSQSAWERYAHTLGIRDRVVFHGLQMDTVSFYHKACVVIVPSDYESDGLVGFEALCCGVPVVASPRAAAGKWLIDGVTGFQASTPSDMAAAIMVLATDPMRARRMGRVGRWVARSYSANRIAERLLSALKSCEVS